MVCRTICEKYRNIQKYSVIVIVGIIMAVKPRLPKHVALALATLKIWAEENGHRVIVVKKPVR